MDVGMDMAMMPDVTGLFRNTSSTKKAMMALRRAVCVTLEMESWIYSAVSVSITSFISG